MPHYPHDSFVPRHLGPREADIASMLKTLGASSLEALIDETIPKHLRTEKPLALPPPLSEHAFLARARAVAEKNVVMRSYIGLGYYGTITPPVILRNILENPGWYTQYTPYQAEISQGRLEALLNFQTMVQDLTALPVANASLLDEATAAAEAMHVMLAHAADASRKVVFVSDACHPQTVDVVRVRAEALGLSVLTGNVETATPDATWVGALLQYPDTHGTVRDLRAVVQRMHAAGALVAVGTDLLALALLTPPGEWGADMAYGSAQRFGVPMGYGGPHAAFFACKQDFVRKLPGRIIGVSKDAHDRNALRMALQTREQHIRREKATSNICTAQALLAVMAGMYAAYHGPEGLTAIAARVHLQASRLKAGLQKLGYACRNEAFFDTVFVEGDKAKLDKAYDAARDTGINLGRAERGLRVALDETVGPNDLADILRAFAGGNLPWDPQALDGEGTLAAPLARTSSFLTHPTFHRYRSETEMLRYLRTLESRDLSLTHSMIPLGSCTMKLNATAEMLPITWPEFGTLHPFAPVDQASGYKEVFSELEGWLSDITGFSAVSLQPNAGSQGEYAGLLVIRRYHESRGDKGRDVCLIPSSAHGTNPASAAMAGMRVVVVACDDQGNVDLKDLEAKAREHKDALAALMLTYPSTHGVFEEAVRNVAEVVHAHGGQIYMDGANMNAQVGLTRPRELGADVCHLNLHKTFCIPHGGGGPGMGPICVAAHLAPFLPNHPLINMGGEKGLGAISAAPWGSANILLISWAYIAMMGGGGLTDATRIAILNANYISERLRDHYPTFYRGTKGRVAHECILDMRHFKRTAGIEVEDIAKRLMDYGFHAPTMSFPIPSTMMVEPTESESKAELDRFCDAMIAIRKEIAKVESGEWPRDNNPLKHAPHTAEAVTQSEWPHPYSRETAAFPLPSIRTHKFWPYVGRVQNALGDRNLVCACPPVESYNEPSNLARS